MGIAKVLKLGLLGFIVFLTLELNAQVSFNRGVNLSGWFQTSGTRQIQYNKYTKEDFENIKSLGCDAIRLPINLFYMTSGSPDYKIDTLFFEFLDQPVSWAEELEMYLILDNHSTDDIASQNPDLENVLSKVWKQMAEHYKNSSSYILYEILNEPNGITTNTWGQIQQTTIEAIREVDTLHALIVGAASWNGYNDLPLLPYYSDSKLLYTFHFYDPLIFTHQGASWSNPSLANLIGVPFPYNPDSMPALPDNLQNTYIENSYNNYNIEGNVEHIKDLIDIAIDFKESRNIDLYCGEFGVYMPYSRKDDRNYWYSVIRKYLEENDIAWTTWDYKGSFGLFNQGSNEMFEYDVNIPLVDSLGLIPPEQETFVLIPDSTGFQIYSDYIFPHVYESSNSSGGIIDYYSTDKPNSGDYCIFWTGSGQYGLIGFDFVPNKDLSELLDEDYALSFLIRGNAPGTKIEVRFIDTKSQDPSDHPWRMNFTIDESLITFDGKWHKVYLELSDFVDMGSWDNAWYDPIGAYDWQATDRFEIVTDQGSLTGKALWFDDIIVTNVDSLQVNDTTIFILPTNIAKLSINSSIPLTVYPNPAKGSVTFSYTLLTGEDVEISIYSLLGKKIKSLIKSHQSAGEYNITWNTDDDFGNKVPEGIYVGIFSSSYRNIKASRIIVIRD